MSPPLPLFKFEQTARPLHNGHRSPSTTTTTEATSTSPRPVPIYSPAATGPVNPSLMASASASSSLQSVRVVLRVRPLLPSEATEAAAPCVSLIGGHTGGEVTVQLKDQHTSRNECYKVDSYFSREDRVSDIFDQEVSALIPGIFEGTNATVFAYGATGSGKTYTMQGSEDLPGLIPLSVSTILARCTGTWCFVEISYYEVYMERCYDLLEPKAKEIMALDDKGGNLQLKGLAWVPVRSMEEFLEVYSIGVQRRKVAHTGLNDVSSRSHAVLSIRISNDIVKGKLNLIDLAGNEDNRRTHNEGIRLQESSKINSSLFALSNVISALKKNEPRIPFRESKLTRILQDSLGGNSRAVMIACLNPVEYQEAAHTLSLAARSGHMVTNMSSASKEQTPKVKVDMEAKLQVWLESKGKTKSIQRTNGLFSPTGCKTPSSMSHMKQPKSALASSRAKAMDRDGGKIKKVLFNLPVHTPVKNTPRPSSRDEVKTAKKVMPPLLAPCAEDKSASPIRKALSPISSNLMALKQQTAYDDNCPPSMEPKTPIGACHIVEKIPIGTPLDKFNALGSNLKESLIQQYLEFLNVADKEELQQLKGIGEKRAEYILELREDSPRPFKSLSDLGNIGLSSKQIQDILRKTATGIFK